MTSETKRGNPAENLLPKESMITPEKVKARVMEFFKGIDLDKDNVVSQGLLTIKTAVHGSTDGARNIESVAIVNGFWVATIEHQFDSEHAIKTDYTLIGEKPFGHKISIILSENNQNKDLSYLIIDDDQLGITSSPGILGMFERNELRHIASIFGIKIKE